MSVLKACISRIPIVQDILPALTPTFTQVRFRTRPSLKNPTVFYNKQRLIELTKPVYPVINLCDHEVPDTRYPKVPITENRYAMFLARQLRQRFYEYPMIAIFHANSYTGHEFLHALGVLYDNDLEMVLYRNRENRQVAIEALRGTKFEPVLPLIVSRTSIGFCKEPNVTKLLKSFKKIPQFLLIGLIYENQLLHRDDMERVAKLGGINSVRAALCQTLQSSSVQLCRTLLTNQSLLSNSLASLASSSITPTDSKDVSN